MDGDTKETRAHQDLQPPSKEVEANPHPGNGEATYWGVRCRTCRELVAFDVSPYVSFGPGAASLKPGAIRCVHGHNHIYFPRDFQFVASAVPISATEMQQHREAYGAINPASLFLPEPLPWPAAEPEANRDVPAPAAAPAAGKPASSAGLLPDPRRTAANAAARKRWTVWAGKKAI